MYLRLNGNTYIGYVYLPSTTAAGQPYLNCTTVVDLSVGDYIEICGFQDSGSALVVNQSAGQQYSPEAEMVYIGPPLYGRGTTNISGAYLSRPAANTVPPGSTYFATDTLGTWLSDGAAWTLVQQRAPRILAGQMGAAPFNTPDQRSVSGRAAPVDVVPVSALKLGCPAVLAS
jgi:hypothetical protein